MPIDLLYLGALLGSICVIFVVFKRPIYEAMLIGYIIMVAISGEWANIFTYFFSTSTNTLFYAIVAFLAVAQVFTSTKVIDSCIEIVLSIFGRFRGGSGYVALIASSFMGALSGSAAGNVAATGVFTIPAMKKSGFPPHLAANIVMAASTMGNMIPPAGVITLAFGILDAMYPGQFTMSNFWLLMWGVSLWFILQRVLTIFVFCRIYHIQPVPAAEIPKFSDALRRGWKAILIPVVIFLPFMLDSMFKETFFAARLGSGASAMSSCTLLFTPGLAALYALFIIRKKSSVGPKKIAEMLSKTVKSIVPVCATIFFSYSISNLFQALDLGKNIGEMITSWGFNIWLLALLLPLFTALLGMILPGSAQIAIFGTAMVTIMAAVGVNPLLVAAMLPVITGAMEGMTPPLALCMYTAMGIANSGMKETTKNCLVWVGLHYALSVVMLTGIVPVLGLGLK